ncbi:MAG: site-specific integrase [Candidatus Brocadiae bacterium]|nr:site-specific integrase [Candidatus Brocadiia bacterium]
MAAKPYPRPLSHKKGFRAHFYWNGKQYRRYVGRDEYVANAIQIKINNLILSFKYGLLTIPENISLPDYIFSEAIAKPDPEEIDNHITFTHLSHLIRYYQENTPTKAPNTLSTEKIHLRHLQNFLNHKRTNPLLESINVGFFNEYKQFRRSQGVLGNTINKELGTFQVMWQLAIEGEYITHNIVRDVKREKKQSNHHFRTTEQVQEALAKGKHRSTSEIQKIKRFRYLSLQEIEELIGMAKDRWGQSHWIIPVLIGFAYTGMRRSELVNLQWEDVDFNEETIVVDSRKQSVDSESESRYIDMTPEIKACLLEQKKRSSSETWVFLGPNGIKLNVHTLRGAFLSMIAGTKFEGIGFHVFRHSLTSNLAAAGVEPWIIARILGHKTQEMHEHYKHLFPDQRKTAMNKLCEEIPKKEEEILPLEDALED